jgi:hypothetical protein
VKQHLRIVKGGEMFEAPRPHTVGSVIRAFTERQRARLLHRMFSRPEWRWLQRLTGVHRIHHDRWSFGWSLPFTTWARFETYAYCDYWDGEKLKIEPVRWRRCPRGTYHDSTTTGRF